MALKILYQNFRIWLKSNVLNLKKHWFSNFPMYWSLDTDRVGERRNARTHAPWLLWENCLFHFGNIEFIGLIQVNNSLNSFHIGTEQSGQAVEDTLLHPKDRAGLRLDHGAPHHRQVRRTQVDPSQQAQAWNNKPRRQSQQDDTRVGQDHQRMSHPPKERMIAVLKSAGAWSVVKPLGKKSLR